MDAGCDVSDPPLGWHLTLTIGEVEGRLRLQNGRRSETNPHERVVGIPSLWFQGHGMSAIRQLGKLVAMRRFVRHQLTTFRLSVAVLLPVVSPNRRVEKWSSRQSALQSGVFGLKVSHGRHC